MSTIKNVGAGRFEYRGFTLRVFKDTRGTSTYSEVYGYKVIKDFFGGVETRLPTNDFLNKKEFKEAVNLFLDSK